MSRHLRFCFAFLLVGGFPTSSASANPFTALFNVPEEAAAPAPAKEAPAPAKEECLQRPGKSTAEGQRWVYRLDGHRKCWHQAKVGAVVRKSAHYHAPKQRIAAPEEKEATPRKKTMVDARAELPRSAKAETSQPAPPAPELKVVDATPGAATGAASLIPPAPVVAQPATDQLTPDRATPPSVDVEMLLAEVPPASYTGASSMPPATTGALSTLDASENRSRWMAIPAGGVLIGLGLVMLLGSLLGSRLLPRAAPIRRALTEGKQTADTDHRSRWITFQSAMSTRPSVMGPMMSSLPSQRRAAELMLLSVVNAWPPHHAVRGSGEPI